MDNPSYIVNVEAAIYKEDKWLIIKRSEKEEHAPGLLSLVGGKVETKVTENSVLEESLIREIMEEVGIKVNNTFHYVESKAFISNIGQAVIDIVFLCQYLSGEPKAMSSEEVAEVYWMSSSEILESKSSPIWLKESIERAEQIRSEIDN